MRVKKLLLIAILATTFNHSFAQELIQDTNELEKYYTAIAKIRTKLESVLSELEGNDYVQNGFEVWPTPNPYYDRTPEYIFLETSVHTSYTGEEEETLKQLYTPFGQVKLLGGGCGHRLLATSKAVLQEMDWDVKDVSNEIKVYNYAQDVQALSDLGRLLIEINCRNADSNLYTRKCEPFITSKVESDKGFFLSKVLNIHMTLDARHTSSFSKDGRVIFHGRDVKYGPFNSKSEPWAGSNLKTKIYLVSRIGNLTFYPSRRELYYFSSVSLANGQREQDKRQFSKVSRGLNSF